MEEDRNKPARLIACVIAGIVGSLIPAGYISFALLVSYGAFLWTYILVITASGALGGYLGWLIMGKFGDKSKLFPAIFVAGIFGFFAGVITYFILAYRSTIAYLLYARPAGGF